MKREAATKLFEEKKVRTHWDAETETWFFSVIDVIEILTGSTIPKRYWTDLKKKLQAEGSQLYEKIVQLKMPGIDGKNYTTDCLDTQNLLRMIQSIPSPKAEPFKQWLAKVGYERIQEIADPAQSLDRARENWQKLGRSEKWIQQRMTGQETRNKLTDYRKENGVEKSDEFALLTNKKKRIPLPFFYRRRWRSRMRLHQEWTGLTVKKHKDIKGLQSQNLCDHMTEAELIFTALAELSTRQIAETDEAQGIVENAKAGKKGGTIAKNARLALEKKTGRGVISAANFLPPMKNRKSIE